MALDQNQLQKIRDELFYDSTEYTKNQPDFYIGHKQQLLAPSETKEFMARIKSALTDDVIMLYVHFPFCFSECRFCNTFPHKVNREEQANYIDDLIAEIRIFAEHGILDGKTIKCVYFGGGTPTAFSNEQLKRVIEALHSVAVFDENCSFTTEAHPVTITSSKRVEELRGMGINRISIGCQTFDPDVQAYCNRENDEALIRRVVEVAHENDIQINIDMMSGLPGQTLESVKRDLDVLESIKPDAVEYMRHEIVNPLAVELFKERPELIVDGDALFEMILTTQQWMAENGYEQNGTFDSTDQWEYRYRWIEEMPIVSFGARARSYTREFCFDKHESLNTYSLMIKRGMPPFARYIELSERDQMYRSLFLSLQKKSGLDCAAFEKRFGCKAQDTFADLLNCFEQYGCIRIDESSIALTKAGAYFVEDICDKIMDYALKEESDQLVRTPNSQGMKSTRLTTL